MKIIIADHNGLSREGLKSLVARLKPGAECLESDDFNSVFQLLSEHHDVGLLVADLKVVSPSGLDNLKLLRERWPHLNVALMTESQDVITMRDAFSLGVVGYLLKSESTMVLEQALQLIFAGGVYVSERFICEPMVENEQAVLSSLTPRQKQVLELLSDGLSNKEIGRLLALAEGTVKAHVAALLKVIGVKNRTQAANWARDRNLV
ncbi:MAG: response regulator transcription factor [Pseudomonadales bacterium]|nr:response regulator transcription factor [Pseudomonadales bacterium]